MPLMCEVCKSSIYWDKEKDTYPCEVCDTDDTQPA